MKKRVDKVAECGLAFGLNHNLFKKLVVKIFVLKTPLSCIEIGNDIRTVKTGNGIDNLVKLAVTVLFKVSGKDSTAEADGKERNLIVACLLFYHFNILGKVVCGLHRVTDEVEGKEINVVLAYFVNECLHGNHSVGPVKVFVGHMLKRIIPALCFKVFCVVALFVTALILENIGNEVVRNLVNAEVGLQQYAADNAEYCFYDGAG